MENDRKNAQPLPSGRIRNELVAAEQFSLGEGLHLAPKPLHALLVFESGMGMLTIQDRKFPISAGRCYYALPSMALAIEPYFNDISVIIVSFERLKYREEVSDGIRYSREDEGLTDWGEIEMPMAPRMLYLAKEMVRASDTPGQLEAAYADRVFHEWLHELMQANIHSTAQEYGNEEAIRRTMRYVDLHYHEELNRNTLAQMAGFSPEYFSVLFKQISGKSLTDYVTALRIHHIKERLLFDDMRLSDLAREVGYQDQYYVSRRFKQEVGVSPTRYVQSAKRIVSLNPHLTMHLLALGIVPSATTAFPWRFGEYDEILHESGCVCRDWASEFTIEEIAGFRPDLIIGIDNIPHKRLRELRQLAPTLVVPWYLGDWREHLHLLARIVRRTEQERKWLEQFDRRLMTARQTLQESRVLEQTALIVNIRETTSFLYLNRGMGSQVVYAELNWPSPAQVRRAVADRAAVDIDLAAILPDYRAEHTIVVTEPSPLAGARMREMLASEHWQAYLQEGRHLYHADMSRWHGYDPLSIQWQLTDIERWFA
ncbi:AraC family transcriptional regulator [Cohnella boryungensis]